MALPVNGTIGVINGTTTAMTPGVTVLSGHGRGGPWVVEREEPSRMR